MNNIILKEKYVLEYIKTILNEYRQKYTDVTDYLYHHNRGYQTAPIVCKHGILTVLDLQKMGINHYTEEQLRKLSDTDSHVNGIDAVSLSITGLNDINLDEDEYDPFNPKMVDFLISGEVSAKRQNEHYGNEFITREGSIPVDKIKSVDIRLIQLNDLCCNSKIHNITEIIENYNSLKEIALSMKESNLTIPLREMSNQDNFNLDIDKLSETKKIILK